MSRTRKYATNAERQKAYRDRHNHAGPKRHGQCEENLLCIVCGMVICRWCSRPDADACDQHSDEALRNNMTPPRVLALRQHLNASSSSTKTASTAQMLLEEKTRRGGAIIAGRKRKAAPHE